MIIERRSTPMRTLSLAFSKSGISTSFLLCRAARRAASPPDGVDLVHEDDARGVLLALLEEIAHARGAHADEHLDEVGPGDREERDVRLARDRLGEERLPSSRRPDQQDALRDLAAALLELLRVLPEVDDLPPLLLRFIHAGNIL